MQKISFQSDNLTIRGTLVFPGGEITEPLPGVIIFHGMTSSENSYIPLAELLAKDGMVGLAISMRGHGRSDGDFNKETVAAATNDALAAYDFLAELPIIDINKIGMVGSSVGAILAATATSGRDIASLVLRAPAAYTSEMMQISMAATMTNEEKQFHEIEKLSATPAGKCIEKFGGDLLVVASEKDHLIPTSITEGYIDTANHASTKKLEIIKGASHQLINLVWQKEFNQLAVNWFKKSL
ncbi:alpha/beta fold hydrolase [Candidatus Saccharibacteria bacterium]|nr:alpha/beta fold hydrolase [Candidatus Saccharibacteria bacterium]